MDKLLISLTIKLQYNCIFETGIKRDAKAEKRF